MGTSHPSARAELPMSSRAVNCSMVGAREQAMVGVDSAIEHHLREDGHIAGRGEKAGMARDAAHGPGIFVVHFAPDQALAKVASFSVGAISGRRRRGGLNIERFMPSGSKISRCAKTSSDSPVRRSTISPSRMNPRSEYSICVPGSRTSGSASTRARIASWPFACL